MALNVLKKSAYCYGVKTPELGKLALGLLKQDSAYHDFVIHL